MRKPKKKPARRAAWIRKIPNNLTPRQTEVLHGLALGLSAIEIAGSLKISIKTVETHRALLTKRLGIRHLSGLVRYALQSGILPRSWLLG